MNICINTSSFPRFKGDYAGAFIYELALALQAKGHKVWVLCPAVKDSPLHDNFDGVEIVRYRYAIPKSYQILVGEKPAVPMIQENKLLVIFIPILLICQFFALIYLVRKQKIDVINSHWLLPQGFISAVVALFFRIKHCSTLHSTDVYLAMKLPFSRFLCRFVEKHAISTFIVGGFVRDRYNSILGYRSASSVVPMGINEEKFKDIASVPVNPEKILFVGRLHKIKGINFLLEAFTVLLRERPSLQLEIVGGGEELDSLKQIVAELGIASSVFFRGFISSDKLPLYYAGAACMAVPSLILPSGETEGMPVVILESLVCGTPVVASNVGGIGDVIKDGINGYLFEPARPDQIADAIRKVLSDKDGILRRQALASSEKYRWDKISSVYLRGMKEKVVEDL